MNKNFFQKYFIQIEKSYKYNSLKKMFQNQIKGKKSFSTIKQGGESPEIFNI